MFPAKIARNQEIVKLRDQAGMKFSDIAQRMGVSKQMVHKIYKQAKNGVGISLYRLR